LIIIDAHAVPLTAAYSLLKSDTILWDRTLKRFGVRCSTAGAISFLIQYRNAQGRSRRLTIGSYPKPWTATLAREEAERLLRVADGGATPSRHDRMTGRPSPSLSFWRVFHQSRVRWAAEAQGEREGAPEEVQHAQD
jgi:Arm DNA-binding domain